MKQLLKSLGPVLMLIGVIILASYNFGVQTNSKLVAGLTVVILGIVAHIITNKIITK